MIPTITIDGSSLDEVVRDRCLSDDVERVSVTIDDDGVMPHFRCTDCGDECFEIDGEGDDGSNHTWERIPLSWANHAAITLDEDDDAIHVSISVGDPRGAFTFTIRRLPDSAPDGGRLLMHLPYPSYPALHEPLTEHHEGTYLIG